MDWCGHGPYDSCRCMMQDNKPDAPNRTIHLYGNRTATMCATCGADTTAGPCPSHQRHAHKEQNP